MGSVDGRVRVRPHPQSAHRPLPRPDDRAVAPGPRNRRSPDARRSRCQRPPRRPRSFPQRRLRPGIATRRIRRCASHPASRTSTAATSPIVASRFSRLTPTASTATTTASAAKADDARRHARPHESVPVPVLPKLLRHAPSDGASGNFFGNCSCRHFGRLGERSRLRGRLTGEPAEIQLVPAENSSGGRPPRPPDSARMPVGSM